MSRQLVFTRKRSPHDKVQSFIKNYKLDNKYCDKSEKIYMNENIILSVTKRVVWILLVGKSNPVLEDEIINFFYNGR